jgi:predicted nucleic acid-binding protein
MSPSDDPVFLDAGLLIGALLQGDPRHAEAMPLVDAARRGDFPACTGVGILSEAYAALTWAGGPSPHTPADAARVIAKLVAPPSAIRVLPDGLDVALRHLHWADLLGLTARRIHDARHAATALQYGIARVYTYDLQDWVGFVPYGLVIAGPPSTLARIGPRA